MDYELEIGSPPELARIFAARLAVEARRALAERARFTLAVPGGSVAQAFLPLLAGAEVDWPLVDLVWVDERAVAPEHPDSNFRLARELWLDRAAARPRVHRFRGEADDLALAAFEGEQELARVLGRPPRLDLALVGVGADGHVAALFPEHPALAERSRLVVAVDDAPKPPRRRLTTTLAAFEGTDLLVVAAFGAEKALVLEEALERTDSSTLPLALALRSAARHLFLFDAGAAHLL